MKESTQDRAELPGEYIVNGIYGKQIDTVAVIRHNLRGLRRFYGTHFR